MSVIQRNIIGFIILGILLLLCAIFPPLAIIIIPIGVMTRKILFPSDLYEFTCPDCNKITTVKGEVDEITCIHCKKYFELI